MRAEEKGEWRRKWKAGGGRMMEKEMEGGRMREEEKKGERRSEEGN